MARALHFFPSRISTWFTFSGFKQPALLLYLAWTTKSSSPLSFSSNIGIVFAVRSRSCWRGEYKRLFTWTARSESASLYVISAVDSCYSVLRLCNAVWSRCFVERSDTDISHTLSTFIFQTYRINPTNPIDASLVNIYSHFRCSFCVSSPLQRWILLILISFFWQQTKCLIILIKFNSY